MSSINSSRDRQAARIRKVSIVGVGALACAGFAMSYDALHALARGQGVPAGLAWLWPLVVDGFIVVASLAVVHAVLDRRRTWYPWCLVLGFSALSVGFNVLNARPTLVARLVAAVPPSALVLSFELLMRQVRVAVCPAPMATVRVPDLVPVPLSRPAPASVPVHRSRPQPQSGGPAVPVLDQARTLVTAQTRAGQVITGVALAAELGVSDGYGRRLLRTLTAEAAGGPVR